MSSKRSFSEVDAQPSANGASNKKRKQFKSHKPRDNTDAPVGQSLNEIKKRARDIERRFARGDQLPADVQRNLERELAHCKSQVEDLQHKKKRNEMISKYHKVRFFGMSTQQETYRLYVYGCKHMRPANRRGAYVCVRAYAERQKAERLRKQLKKRLEKAADDPEEKTNIEKELHIADVDWYYTRYFPFMEPYISLYPKTKEESDDEPIAKRALHAERPPVWKEIEEAAEEGQKALEAIQERRPEKTDSTKEPVSQVKARPRAPPKDKFDGMSQERRLRLGRPEKENVPVKVAKNRRERRKEERLQQEQKKAVEEAADDDSDGSGFFDA